METCCSEKLFAKQRLALIEMNKLFFSYFLFEVKIVTWNLRCHRLVLLCLINPTFATWSLALHTNVVSDKLRWLGTFASLALSTLALSSVFASVTSSACHLFTAIFLGTYWLDLSDVFINTTTGSRSIIFESFSCWKFFQRVIVEKNSVFRFFRGQRVYFKFSFYTRLGIANVALSAGLKVMHISWKEENFKQCVRRRVLIRVLTWSEFFSRIYCRKMSKNRFPYFLSTLPKFFYAVAQTRNSSGLCIAARLSGEAVESISAYPPF